jgi:hypothetical protein
LTWVGKLQVTGLDGDTVNLVTQPGQRDLLAFITESRKAQLADLITTVAGKRIRVALSAAQQDHAASDLAAAPASAAGAARALNRQEQARALELPLVKQVMQVFDGATLVGVAKGYNQADGSAAPAKVDDPTDDRPQENDEDHVG